MVPVEEQETDELRSFRESWKRELREKQKSQQPPQQDSGHPTTPPKHIPASEAEARSSRPLQSRDDALEVYIRAVRQEQAGELDEALRLYRQAFRMNPGVDRVYYLREKREARAQEASTFSVTSVGPEIGLKTVNGLGPGEVTRRFAQIHTKLAVHHPDRYVSGVLARIVANFPEALFFEPEDEMAPLFLQWLPDELLVHILRYLGTKAIERFACVCRKARVITLDTAIWRLGFPLVIYVEMALYGVVIDCAVLIVHLFHRSFVETVYKPPQISPNEILDDIVDNYSSDYRRVYVELPRVRLDGVYIAVCHYMYLLQISAFPCHSFIVTCRRHGLSENAWVNVGRDHLYLHLS